MTTTNSISFPPIRGVSYSIRKVKAFLITSLVLAIVTASVGGGLFALKNSRLALLASSSLLTASFLLIGGAVCTFFCPQLPPSSKKIEQPLANTPFGKLNRLFLSQLPEKIAHDTEEDQATILNLLSRLSELTPLVKLEIPEEEKPLIDYLKGLLRELTVIDFTRA